MSQLSKLIADLAPEKRDFLARRLQQLATNRVTNSRVAPRAKGMTQLPLSFSQQRLWFLDQMDPGNSAYNLSKAVRLGGPLDSRALTEGLNEVVRRHEILRTTFPALNGQPVQRVAQALSLAVPFSDLSGLDEGTLKREIKRLVAEEANAPFDLCEGPLLRARFLRTREDEHIVLLTMHHIISDDWSMGILIRELTTLYEAFSQGRPSPLRPLAIQYADYSVWQRERLKNEAIESHLSYWERKLAGIAPILQLPTDRPRPAVQSLRGASRPLVIREDLASKLKELSKAEGCTLFITLLAAFKTLLYRFTDQEDISIGTPIAGRDRLETESLIGFFINTLLLRTDLSGDPPFRAVLRRVRETVLDATSHQDLPFEKIVERLQPERSLSHTPLFQVMFALQTVSQKAVDVPGLKLSPVTSLTTSAKFDLTLDLAEAGGEISGALVYSTDLFDRETIDLMIQHFEVLLGSIATRPDTNISMLQMLSEEQRRKIVYEWNAGEIDHSNETLISELFEEQVRRSPNAVALESDRESLTYFELNRRANKLAHYLKAQGVGPEKIVAVFLERSADVVIAMLATLKAGGVYLPLDTTYPSDRLAFILSDTRASVLLTRERFASAAPAGSFNVVCLDDDSARIDECEDDNPSSSSSPDNLAYVIYTSGSTGLPKGVCIAQRALVDHCRIIKSAFGMVSTDRVLQFSSLNFDVSIEQIIPTLLVGAAIVMRGQEIWSTGEFWKRVREMELTVINPPTAYWHQLVDGYPATETQASGNRLRLIIAGGDVLLPESISQWRRKSKSLARILNGYGPTETTISSSFYEIPFAQAEKSGPGKIPVGRPLPNRSFYVLDRNGEPAPVGVAGELHIGRSTLARGYLNLPDLTAQKFVPDPFSSVPGARLYKTGDLVRYLPDGNMEFFGRIDHQVKVRGFRIELEEIEAALGEHPEIRETAAKVIEDRAGQKRIAAFYVAKETDLNSADLRRFLKDRLPEYMVPSTFARLDALPMTSTGKVDRNALKITEQARDNSKSTFESLATPVEKTLAQIWAAVLGIERVGAHDNFFDLGGDSILSIQIIARANEEGLQLSPKQIFQHQTIAELARVARQVDAARTESDSGGVERIKERLRRANVDRIVEGDANIDDIYPVSPVQHGMLFHSLYAPASGTYFMQNGCTFRGGLDVRALKDAWSRVVDRHPILRTAFLWEGLTEPLQVVRRQVELRWDERDLRGSSPEEQRALIGQYQSEDRQRGFDPGDAPMMRFALFQLSDDSYHFVWSHHHILLDGWSAPLVLKEVLAFYKAITTGAEIELEQPRPYRNYIEWLLGKDASKAESFWRDYLKGFTAPTQLSAIQLGATSSVKDIAFLEKGIRLSAELSEALRSFAANHKLTLNTVLQGAWALLLSRYSNKEDIAFGVTVSGRPPELEGVESIVGLFINTLPVRIRVSPERELSDFLSTLQEKQVELREYEYTQLVEIQGSSEVPRGQSLFESILVFEKFPDKPSPGAAGAGLKVGGVWVKTPNHYPFTLRAVPGNELALQILYDGSRFDAAGIERVLSHLKFLLENLTEHPRSTLGQLQEVLAMTEKRQTQMDERKHKQFKHSLFKTVEPKTIRISQQSLVKTEFVNGEESMPLVVRPGINDLDLVEWASDSRQFIESQLFKYGAILFRGFNLDSVNKFEQFAQATSNELYGEYGDLPREGVGGKVYGSTPYPNDKAILFHNESSHMNRWPMKIWFHCVKAALRGGETPIVDCRRLYERVDESIRRKLEEKKVMYVRNFVEGLDVSWERFYGTSERSEVERRCKEAGIEYEWIGERGLRTRQVREAVKKHPRTGEKVMFNQLQLHHVSCLEEEVREGLRRMYGDIGMPRKVCYGDGSEIAEAEMEEIGRIYEEEAKAFKWEEGDIMMMDNMLVAHGRRGFEGERKIVVAMGEMRKE